MKKFYICILFLLIQGLYAGKSNIEIFFVSETQSFNIKNNKLRVLFPKSGLSLITTSNEQVNQDFNGYYLNPSFLPLSIEINYEPLFSRYSNIGLTTFYRTFGTLGSIDQLYWEFGFRYEYRYNRNLLYPLFKVELFYNEKVTLAFNFDPFILFMFTGIPLFVNHRDEYYKEPKKIGLPEIELGKSNKY